MHTFHVQVQRTYYECRLSGNLHSCTPRSSQPLTIYLQEFASFSLSPTHNPLSTSLMVTSKKTWHWLVLLPLVVKHYSFLRSPKSLHKKTECALELKYNAIEACMYYGEKGEVGSNQSAFFQYPPFPHKAYAIAYTNRSWKPLTNFTFTWAHKSYILFIIMVRMKGMWVDVCVEFSHWSFQNL